MKRKERYTLPSEERVAQVDRQQVARPMQSSVQEVLLPTQLVHQPHANNNFYKLIYEYE